MVRGFVCPVCAGEDFHQFTGYPKRNWAVYACSGCTNAYTFPQPGQVSYDEHRFADHYQKDEPRWRSYATPILKFIGRQVPSGRLLDVGCAGGLLIDEALRLGYQAEGIEPSSVGVSYCLQRGLQVRRGYFEADTYPSETFSVVVLAHVVEHVPDALALLRSARRVLRPNGVLCLSQTNYLGTIPKTFGRYWPYWVPQEHLVHFSPSGLRALLAKAGFEVVAHQFSSLDYPVNLELSNFRHWPGTGLFAVLRVISRLHLGLPFQGDQMYVLARPG